MRCSNGCVLSRVTVAVFVALFALVATPLGAAGKTSLWRVSSASNTMYLLGSIHLLTESDYPLNDAIERAFQEAEVVVFEVHPDSLQAPSVQMYVLQNAMYGEGETLQTQLGDSVYAIVSARAESLGVDLGPMTGFKPWFVSISLALFEMQRMGLNPELGVEMYFAKKAEEQEKEVSGLETAKYQLGLFIGLSDEQQRDLLMHTLAQLSDIEKDLGKLVAAWKDGELADVENTLNKSFRDFPEVFERLVTQRNRTWAAQIDELLRDGKIYMVVVGVGHMAGEEGLLELLKKKGLNVEQL